MQVISKMKKERKVNCLTIRSLKVKRVHWATTAGLGERYEYGPLGADAA